MKVKRRLESIINVPGQQSVGRLNSLLSCKELQSVYTEYTVPPAEQLKKKQPSLLSFSITRKTQNVHWDW